MGPALLTAFFFSMSVIFAGRSVRLVGGVPANFSRLFLGLVILAAYAHFFGEGWNGRGFPYFVASGVIGLGLGDIAFFRALPLLGPRLSILFAQCLAAPLGALIEWFWLGTTLSHTQLAGGGLILAGVAIALGTGGGVRALAPGAFWATLAALGQGGGAVISRHATEIDALDHLAIDGATAAYQRLLGGILISAIAFLIVRARKRRVGSIPADPPARWGEALPWIVGNSVFGLVLGVACYQWALRETATGIVLCIVATTSLMTIPLAWWIDGDRPTGHALLGAVVAVIGVVLLRLS